MIKKKLLSILKKDLKYPYDMELGIDQRGFASLLEKKSVDLIKKNFEEAKIPESVRSIEDIMINDNLIDIKTTDVDKEFKMPNLISIDRLKKIYKDKNIIYVFISYSPSKKKIVDVAIFYIWEISWNNLAIQNLGKGQIQIKNMKNFVNSNNINEYNKDSWYKELHNNGILFYESLFLKTKKYLSDWKKYD